MVRWYFNIILGKHTIFGRIKTGMKTIQRISFVKTDSKTDRPLVDVKIIKASVIE